MNGGNKIMKICGKRIFSFLTVIVLLLSLVSTNLTVHAEEGKPFEPMNGYTLAYGTDSNVSPYAYFSPFVPTLTYNGESVDGYSILFGLKDTKTNTISEIAYCTDMPVDAIDGTYYQRLNLTDSTYAATHADKLRAIVLNSYPYTDLNTLITASGISDLTPCEAITATQLAVWKAAHGDIVQITDFMSYCSTTISLSNSAHATDTQNERDAYHNGSDEYKAAVKSRIEALYNYLMALKPQSATSTVISEAVFTDHDTPPTFKKNEDGTYNITVSVTVDIPAGSNVTLTAYLENKEYYAQTQSGISSGTYELTIENVPASYINNTITFSIDGTQTVSEDVFLLDAEGIRGTSQSLIAPLSGEFPVHAEVKAEPDRVLTINKSDGETPLANISFEVYYVGSVDDFRDGKLGIGSSPTDADINKYAQTENLVGTITTDSTGVGSLNFSTEDGVYLIKELPNKLVTSSVAFFISLPDYSHIDENGKPAYTITASPKNTLITEDVDIEKDVTNIDNEHDTYDVGENHTWIIQSSIPNNIATGKEYTVSDTLDKRLTFISVDKVALARDNGTFGNSEDEYYEIDPNETAVDSESILLTENTDYTVTSDKINDNTQDTFTVSLTAAGMKKAAAALKNADSPCNELRIYFTAQINSKAGMGEQIPNQAHVKYTNNIGKTYEKDSDVPEVHTGGIQLLKVDSKDPTKTLAGATFKVYRKATDEEIEAGVETTTLTINNEKQQMILVSFYSSMNSENDKYAVAGEKVTSLTTGSDGKGYIYGLAYGDYYLVETKAPAGYNTLSEPTHFIINSTSHLTDSKITVTNVSGTELPSTGGIGTTIFTISGILLMGVAGLFLFKKKYTV